MQERFNPIISVSNNRDSPPMLHPLLVKKPRAVAAPSTCQAGPTQLRATKRNLPQHLRSISSAGCCTQSRRDPQKPVKSSWQRKSKKGSPDISSACHLLTVPSWWACTDTLRVIPEYSFHIAEIGLNSSHRGRERGTKICTSVACKACCLSVSFRTSSIKELHSCLQLPSSRSTKPELWHLVKQFSLRNVPNSSSLPPSSNALWSTSCRLSFIVNYWMQFYIFRSHLFVWPCIQIEGHCSDPRATNANPNCLAFSRRICSSNKTSRIKHEEF